MRALLALFGLIALTTTTPATAADANTAIQTCVNTLRAEQRFNWFDAYYNQGSQSVQTNVMYGYQQEALFPFFKCMASQGFPMGSSSQQSAESPQQSGSPNQGTRGFSADELRRYLSAFQRSNCAIRDASRLSDDELKSCLGIQ
jgi:hypothetical protein